MRSRLLIASLAVFLGGGLGPLCQAACARSEAPPADHHAESAMPCHAASHEGAAPAVSSAPPAGCSACLQAASLAGSERLASDAKLQLLALVSRPAPAAAPRVSGRPRPVLPRARSSPHALFLKHASLLL